MPVVVLEQFGTFGQQALSLVNKPLVRILIHEKLVNSAIGGLTEGYLGQEP